MSKKDDNVISLPSLVGSVVLSNMASQVEELKKQKREVCEQAIRTLLHALDAKDHYTYGHCMRVAHFSLLLGKEINLEGEDLYQLEVAALFHDIGKIGTPDAILRKPSRLEEEEFLIMKEHPSLSGEILSSFTEFKDAAKFARHHHERYDGRGYPDRLKGDEIPLFSRVILIADTFDAMTSTRPYRKGLPYEVAFNELVEFSGSQFDPSLVKHFINALKKEDQESDFFIPIMQKSFSKKAA